jgi:hypothetical protein
MKTNEKYTYTTPPSETTSDTRCIEIERQGSRPIYAEVNLVTMQGEYHSSSIVVIHPETGMAINLATPWRAMLAECKEDPSLDPALRTQTYEKTMLVWLCQYAANWANTFIRR